MKRGFTLIEISIVIVIIGMLVATVVVGKGLLENSQLNSLITDAEKYRSAILNFKQRYNYYPGDFPKAEAVWGSKSSPACSDTGATAVSSTPSITTCNGSGNGAIAVGGGTEAELREGFTMWQHLANAGFIDGRFSGFSTSAANTRGFTAGVNVPATRYKDAAGFNIVYWTTFNATQSAARDTPSGGSFIPAGRLGHVFSWSDSSTGVTSGGMIDVADAYRIDMKIDDALPYTGKIFASETGDASTCISSSAYNMTASTTFCSQYWRQFLE